jgi:hypothetical protein
MVERFVTERSHVGDAIPLAQHGAPIVVAANASRTIRYHADRGSCVNIVIAAPDGTSRFEAGQIHRGRFEPARAYLTELTSTGTAVHNARSTVGVVYAAAWEGGCDTEGVRDVTIEIPRVAANGPQGARTVRIFTRTMSREEIARVRPPTEAESRASRARSCAYCRPTRASGYDFYLRCLHGEGLEPSDCGPP